MAIEENVACDELRFSLTDGRKCMLLLASVQNHVPLQINNKKCILILKRSIIKYSNQANLPGQNSQNIRHSKVGYYFDTNFIPSMAKLQEC